MSRAVQLVLMLFALVALAGCGAERPMKVPGETDIQISSVTLVGAKGAELQNGYGPLIDRLGMRKKSLLLPGRYYSEFREAEDRRRLIAYWQTYGYFDVDVEPPKLEFSADKTEVAITWTIAENERYDIHSVHLLHAPKGYEQRLKSMIPFAAGEKKVDLEAFRKVRITMYDLLRDDGFGHARVYSRAFVDRGKKNIRWYYYVDAGPQTRVGKVMVEGNHKIPAEVIIDRVGLKPGDPYAYGDKIQREFDLLDSGAFAAAFIRTTADTTFLVPGDAPDTGGVIDEEQIDEDGNLIPRDLPPEIDLTIHVREAPSEQLRVRAGGTFDPSRIDTSLNARLWLRNLLGPMHHVTLEGRIGFGYLWRSATDDPTGLYGDAQLRYLKPGLLGRLGDFRLTGRFRQELFPGFHLREVTAGPGVRTTITKGLFFDADLLFRYGQEIDFGPFDAASRDTFNLSQRDDAIGGEAQLGIIWDARDNPLETLSGHLLALRTSFSPGDPIGTHRYLTLAPEGRGFIPIGESLALGARAAADWVVLNDAAGVPLGPRLFGGGAYGFRGLGRHQLSPRAPACVATPEGNTLACQGVPVGGLSMFEGSLEGRFLPPLKPYGAVVFGDFGAAGPEANPFSDGLSLAVGLGLRLRFWYLPAAIDVSYRVLRDNAAQVLDDEPFGVFFRLGEAF